MEEKQEGAGEQQGGSGGKRYYLMKSEPEEFSLDDLAAKPDQTGHWEGGHPVPPWGNAAATKRQHGACYRYSGPLRSYLPTTLPPRPQLLRLPAHPTALSRLTPHPALLRQGAAAHAAPPAVSRAQRPGPTPVCTSYATLPLACNIPSQPSS